ncbi:MAG: acetyltransferase [Bacteroidota bacterium]|jgi:sugar O-acyltransferase (sialic acid O-acetyltransferase NeuD family)
MICFIGYGVLGKQIAKLAGIDNGSRSIIAFDDFATPRQTVTVKPFDNYKDTLHEMESVYIGVGYKHLSLRHSILTSILKLRVNAPPVVHASCSVADTTILGAAAYIYAGSIIDEDVVIQNGAILNNGVTVSHDSIVGECSFLAPGVIVCGNVKIGHRTFVGAGSIISNGVVIGDDVIIGAGTLVSKDVPSNGTVVGNPMRFISSSLLIR